MGLFVTDASWREDSDVLRTMVLPYSAWRVVGIVLVGPSFLILLDPTSVDESQYVRGFLVDSVENLLEVLGQLSVRQRKGMRAYVLQDQRVEQMRELWICPRGGRGKYNSFAYLNHHRELVAIGAELPAVYAMKKLVSFAE
jgi:hypothetical protein